MFLFLTMIFVDTDFRTKVFSYTLLFHSKYLAMELHGESQREPFILRHSVIFNTSLLRRSIERIVCHGIRENSREKRYND